MSLPFGSFALTLNDITKRLRDTFPPERLGPVYGFLFAIETGRAGHRQGYRRRPGPAR